MTDNKLRKLLAEATPGPWVVERKAHKSGAAPDLAAEVLRLREALEPFANATILPDGFVVGMERLWFARARAALTKLEGRQE